MKLEFYDDKKEKSDSVECHINFESKANRDETIASLENITGQEVTSTQLHLIGLNSFRKKLTK